MPLFMSGAPVPGNAQINYAQNNPGNVLLNSASNYQYPLTSGLMSSLSQPGAIPGLVQNMGGQSVNAATGTPTGSYGGPDYSQIALQMAGNPHAGPYAAAPVPSGSFISNPATSSSNSGNSSLGTTAAGLLGILASNPSLAKTLGGTLGSGLQALLGSGAVSGSAASTGSLGDTGYTPLTADQLTPITGDFGLSGDPASQGADLSGLYPDGSSSGDGSLLDSLNFSGAGGQAASQYQPLTADQLQPVTGDFGLSGSPQSNGADLSGLYGGSNASLLSSLGLGAGAIGALLSGKPAGQAQAGLDATKIAAQNGAALGFSPGTSSALNSAAGVGGNALGLYTGLQAGGVSGDTQAAVNAAALADKAATASGLLSSGAGSAIGSGLGYVAAPLALYNAATNWQSGATGSDALNGASAGAAIGSIVPGIGTLIGGAIGGLVGAASSAFGGGRQDPETASQQTLDKAAPGTASALTTPQSFQYLAGIMDAKNNTAGHSAPIEQVFGRMGEGALLDGIAGQVNSAVGSGAISASTPPAQVYSQVIAPWLQSKGAAIDPNSVDVKGNNEGQNTIAAIQNLIGSYMGGSLTSATPIGVSGQADGTLPLFAGLSASPPPQVNAAQAGLTQQQMANLYLNAAAQQGLSRSLMLG